MDDENFGREEESLTLNAKQPEYHDNVNGNDHNEEAAFSSDESDIELIHHPASTSTTTKSRSSQKPLLQQPTSTKTVKFGPFRIWPLTRWCVFVWALVIGILLILLAALGGTFYVYQTPPDEGQSPPWYPSPRGGVAASWENCYIKAKEMVEQMTLIEKVNITTGTGWQMGMCVGNTGSVDSVRFPELCLQDGPLGLRFADNVTVFPAGITTGATWNRELMNMRGQAMGVEAKLKGINVLMGPVVGPLGRMPAGGRNWEGFGADPVLQGFAAADTVRGIQSEGVMATIKHLVGNEQEHFRQSFEWGLPNAISSNIDDRTLHELYLWPFVESVRVGVASVMCSYNQLNNSYACQNSKLLNGILKDELAFQGFVVSDWLAQRSGVASALAGLDMTMPGDGLRWTDGDGLWGSQLTRAVLNGSVPMERINDMTSRVVAAWCQVGQQYWDMPPPYGDGGPNFSSWTNEEEGLLHPGSDDKTKGVVNKFVNAQGEGETAHKVLARKIAAEGTVLVKNEGGILPLSRNGPGSGHESTSEKYRIGVFGEDAGSGRGPNACADRGCNQGTLAQGWGSGTVEFPYLVSPWDALQTAFDADHVMVTSHLDNSPPSEKLADQDLCIVFANSDGGEGYIASGGIKGDRNDLLLQKGGEELVSKVAKECGGDTVVVVHAVGPVVIEAWADLPGVKAILFAHLPGQESGNAIVDVLLGTVDASGRLPYTVGKSLSDYGPGGQVLYTPNGAIPQQDFGEGLYIDYRYFDQKEIEPRYAFGYGLSYTTFTISNMVITERQEKVAFPDPPRSGLAPPTYSNKIPSPSTALFPDGFRKLKKYIYPYLTKLTSDVNSPSLPPHFYYNTASHSAGNPSPGGNEFLFDNVLRVNVDLENTGSRTGSVVPQLYVTFPSGVIDPITNEKIDFPPRVLRAWRKEELVPGQKRTVTMFLSRRDMSYWSVGAQEWVLPTEGKFRIVVGEHVGDEALEGWW